MMKRTVAAGVVASALASYAAPASAALVQFYVELDNHTSKTLVIPAISSSSGAYSDPGPGGFGGSCKNLTSNGLTQSVTLFPGECAHWETTSTGGTSGTSGRVDILPATTGLDIGIQWDFDWACGIDNFFGFGCTPSSFATILPVPGASLFVAPINTFEFSLQVPYVPPSQILGGLGGPPGIINGVPVMMGLPVDVTQGASGGIDGTNAVFVLEDGPGTTAAALTASPPTVPAVPPISPPQNCQWFAGCDGTVNVTCDALQYDFGVVETLSNQWLGLATTSPPYAESTLFDSAFANIAPGETLPFQACFFHDGLSSCASTVNVTAPSVAQCTPGTTGGTSGGGSSGGKSGGRGPNLQ